MTTETSDRVWLGPEEQRAWRAYLVGTTLLMDRLDRDLREGHGLSLPEYEIMVRLSEAPARRMRMAALAASLSHSRSRVTHTVSRMERTGAVVRNACDSDGRGVEASLTDPGMALLVEASHTHVRGVRDLLVDVASPSDFAALGRVFDTVSDRLVSANPAIDIR